MLQLFAATAENAFSRCSDISDRGRVMAVCQHRFGALLSGKTMFDVYLEDKIAVRVLPRSHEHDTGRDALEANRMRN
jgi:hypothetical protein